MSVRTIAHACGPHPYCSRPACLAAAFFGKQFRVESLDGCGFAITQLYGAQLASDGQAEVISSRPQFPNGRYEVPTYELTHLGGPASAQPRKSGSELLSGT